MILSGEKKEEYREINPYWAKRFLCDVAYHHRLINEPSIEMICDYIIKGSDLIVYDVQTNDVIRFANGGHFHKSIPQFSIKCQGMRVGTGKPEWGAEPGKKYFVIKLGERITETVNLK